MRPSPENGAVPDGWQLVRLGDVAEIVMGQSPPGATVFDWNADSTVSRGLPFIQGNAEFGPNSPKPLKWCAQPAKVARVDDILISVRAPVGETNRANTKIGIGRGLAAIRFAVADARAFGWHALNHAKNALEAVTQGSTFKAIGGQDLRSLPILLPPPPEQQAIATVLDSIDEAIERTETVIAATEQVRDSLLHKLLTCGVPGWHREWKEVPGVGTIPACWEVVRLGEVAEVRNGTTPSRARLDYWQVDEVPFVKTGQVNDVFIVEPDEFITSQAVTAGAVVVPKGSVLIAMIGQGKTRGMTARLGFDAAINQNFAAVYGADEDFSLEFFFAWARHNYSVIRALGQGSNQDALNCALIEGMRSPKPPVAEQRAITAMLDSIDEAIKQTRNEREELQSLKASAADALLTGRVRVPTGKVRTNA